MMLSISFEGLVELSLVFDLQNQCFFLNYKIL